MDFEISKRCVLRILLFFLLLVLSTPAGQFNSASIHKNISTTNTNLFFDNIAGFWHDDKTGSSFLIKKLSKQAWVSTFNAYQDKNTKHSEQQTAIYFRNNDGVIHEYILNKATNEIPVISGLYGYQNTNNTSICWKSEDNRCRSTWSLNSISNNILSVSITGNSHNPITYNKTSDFNDSDDRESMCNFDTNKTFKTLSSYCKGYISAGKRRIEIVDAIVKVSYEPLEWGGCDIRVDFTSTPFSEKDIKRLTHDGYDINIEDVIRKNLPAGFSDSSHPPILLIYMGRWTDIENIFYKEHPDNVRMCVYSLIPDDLVFNIPKIEHYIQDLKFYRQEESIRISLKTKGVIAPLISWDITLDSKIYDLRKIQTEKKQGAARGENGAMQ